MEKGQKEIRAEMATKADVLSVGVKVDKLKKRIEGIEEHEGIPHPDKTNPILTSPPILVTATASVKPKYLPAL